MRLKENIIRRMCIAVEDSTKACAVIYSFALVFQVLCIVVLPAVVHEIPNGDPWFEWTAFHLVRDGTLCVHWGTGTPDQDGPTGFHIQKGTYCNWRPPGYSFFLAIPALMGSYYLTARTVLQLLTYSLMPVFIYLCATIVFQASPKQKQLALIGAIGWCFYPSFALASIQTIDTWLIALVNVIGFYLVLRLFSAPTTRQGVALGLILCILFFLRPAGIASYLAFFAVIPFCLAIPRRIVRSLVHAVVMLACIVGIYTYYNYISFHRILIGNSNAGYNFWLGNNGYTSGFLSSRWGDGATIEDAIIPRFDSAWSFLEQYNEYDKDGFFLKQGFDYIRTHPAETVENAAWKVFGYWSPYRARQGDWTDSSTKKVVLFVFFTPVLLCSALSIGRFCTRKEWRLKPMKTMIIVFLFLWMVPYLFFFTSYRFRVPTDFCLVLLCLDFLEPHLSGLLQRRQAPISTD